MMIYAVLFFMLTLARPGMLLDAKGSVKGLRYLADRRFVLDRDTLTSWPVAAAGLGVVSCFLAWNLGRSS